MEIQRHLFVAGRVQGVGYRASTYKQALTYPKLRGFVRNLEDGRVEVVFSGPKEAVLAMVQWCGRGPILARVDEVQIQEESVDPSFSRFEIR